MPSSTGLGLKLWAACRHLARPPKSPSTSAVPRKRAYARALDRANERQSIAERRGRRAETLACWYLRLHGWHDAPAPRPGPRRRSRYRRPARTHPGLRRGQGTRIGGSGEPRARPPWRLKRVAIAAERLAPRFMRAGDDVRIDAIFIVPVGWPKHLPDVWQG